MALNRRVHLAPQRPIAVVEERESREGPKKSRSPFEHVFVDFRYLDAKPGGVQLYSTLLLEGFSRTILAGSLTPDQDAGVLWHVYLQAFLKEDCGRKSSPITAVSSGRSHIGMGNCAPSISLR